MTEGALFQITKYTDEKKMSWQIKKWRVWNFKGSTRLAAGNCAGSANDVNVTSKILAVNFSVLRPRKNDVTVALSSFLRSGVRKCSLVDP